MFQRFDLGCRGWENWVVEGLRASNRERSGVMVREIGFCCGLSTWFIADDLLLVKFCWEFGLGVDHEKEAGFDGSVALLVCRFVAFAGMVSQPPSIVLATKPVAPVFPCTSRSKSSSVLSAPLLLGKPVTPPNAMKSSFCVGRGPEALPELEDISWSFFVCSCSTREDRLLISSMKLWNC